MTGATTRLHISPFSPDLLSAVLGPSLNGSALNVSYHSLQTFPENCYGYIELPNMDAEKVKKKLNGAILKGNKIKVEDARPKKRQHADTDQTAGDDDAADKSGPRKSKRTKKQADVLPAHELSPDRKVKRGWTEPKAERVQKKRKKDKDNKKDKVEKVQAPSKYTDKEELLFKTKIPTNKTGDDGKKGKRDKSGADVVHEFKHNTAMPSFLRAGATSNAKPAVEYADGRGWIDEDGNVVEEESGRASRKRKAAKLGLEIDVTKAQSLTKNPVVQDVQPHIVEGSTSSPSIASSEESDEQEKTSEAGYTSSSGTSASSESSEEDEDVTTPPPAITTTLATPKEDVHPLEALFKKPSLPVPYSNHPTDSTVRSKDVAKPTLELNTAFSFFDADAVEEDIEDKDNNVNGNSVEINHGPPTMPMTPFSSQDFRTRTIRSAAPTPDTADPRRSKGYASLMLGEDSTDDELSEAEEGAGDGDDDRESTPTQTLQTPESSSTTQQTLKIPQSDFEKKFWEKRGENNRAWKARRRAVLKENRQRENRARRPKAW